MLHFFSFLLLVPLLLVRTHRIASSKTCFSPSCVSAEHSRYLNPFSSEQSTSPWALDTGDCLLLSSSFKIAGSLRRSTFVPTMIKGTPGACCWISGIHLFLIFSYEVGEVIEKQTRKMSLWGYERGLNRITLNVKTEKKGGKEGIKLNGKKRPTEGGHNLLVPLYPKDPNEWRDCLPSHWRNNYRKQWEHIPQEKNWLYKK